MVEKCPAKYKNLNYIQSFSEQGYATIQLMQQACMNDEWLRQRVLKLNYLTPPAVRKWYKNLPKWINKNVSYGYKFDANGNVIFDNTLAKTLHIDFVNDDDKIDLDKTDAAIVSFDGVNYGVISSTTTEETDLSNIPTNDEIEEVNYNSDGDIITLNANGEVTGVIPVEEKETNIIHRCQLPFENEAKKKTYTTTKVIKGQDAIVNLSTSTMEGGVNSAWYVGFNKSLNYYVRPDWLADWRDSEIPSVCRGQTFRATVTGQLESIDLKLDYTGTLNSNCGSPLYVQIWNTVEQSVPKTQWNENTNQMEYVYAKTANGTGGDYKSLLGRFVQTQKGTGQYTKIYEKVPMPDTTTTGIYKPLAQASFNPSKMNAFDNVNIKFDKECRLVEGTSYFIALFSPLSEWKHCPRWGGWGRNCARDQKYLYGNAFLSEDNGRSWIRYGRNDTSVDYKLGKYVPQDFAFQCHIRTRDKIDTRTETKITLVEDQIDDAGPDNPRYLYLKPIFDNPITHVRISADDFGNDRLHYSEHGVAVRYEFATNLDRTWREADTDSWYEISKVDGKFPHILLVRAKLYRDIETMETTNGINHQKYYKATPYINSMSVDIITQLPYEMYVRTHEYQPRMGDNILGASIWGRLYSEFSVEPTVTCTAEIVTNERPTDHFKIIEIEDVKEYAMRKGLNDKYITGLNNQMKLNNVVTNNKLCEYLYANQEVIEELKKKNVYIKPYIYDDYVYRLSFTPPNENMKISLEDYENPNYEEDNKELGLKRLGGLQFSNNVAYPILECVLTPDGSTADPTFYGEWFDYEFDYDSNTLTFYKNVLDELPRGDISVSYNKVFIGDLTQEELGVHIDPETGLREEGLILDYFKQTFIIDEENVETRRINLRAEPVDPIREVVLNRDTDNEKELQEGYDYEVDIENSALIFEVNNTDGVSSILSVGDTIEVVYTPNIQASALSVGYKAKRTSRDKNVKIGKSYWEYKV